LKFDVTSVGTKCILNTNIFPIVLYSFIVQVDRTQVILRTIALPTSCIYKVHVFGSIDCTYYRYNTCNKYQT